MTKIHYFNGNSQALEENKEMSYASGGGQPLYQ